MTADFLLFWFTSFIILLKIKQIVGDRVARFCHSLKLKIRHNIFKIQITPKSLHSTLHSTNSFDAAKAFNGFIRPATTSSNAAQVLKKRRRKHLNY